MSRQMRLAAVFTAVAEEGGFRAAGRRLGISAAQVSQGVTDLEAELGTALLYRSTRKLQLTNAAEAILPHFRMMMESFEEGMATLRRANPGEIRISIPTALAFPIFAEALAVWKDENPDTRVFVDVSDGHFLRAGSNADLFIRIGGPSDDLRIARLLCEVGGFLAMRPGAFCVAETADDLVGLPLAVPAGLRTGFTWMNSKSQEKVTLGASPAFVVNNTQMLRELMLTGRVVAPLFDFEARTLFGTNDVVNAAPDWTTGRMPVRAIYASDRPVLSPARSLVEFLGSCLPELMDGGSALV